MSYTVPHHRSPNRFKPPCPSPISQITSQLTKLSVECTEELSDEDLISATTSVDAAKELETSDQEMEESEMEIGEASTSDALQKQHDRSSATASVSTRDS